MHVVSVATCKSTLPLCKVRSAFPVLKKRLIGYSLMILLTYFSPFPLFSGARPDTISVKETFSACWWLESSGLTLFKVSKIPKPRSAKTISFLFRSYPNRTPGISGQFPKLWSNELFPISPASEPNKEKVLLEFQL